MARSRTTRTIAPTRATLAVSPVVTDWRRDAVVLRLTAKVHGLLGAAARRSAEDVVKIGAHLQQIHARLPYGQWLDWVDENAPFSRSTATNYMELATWAGRVPAQFARLRHLGPGKLYVLASAPPHRVAALRPGKLVAIAGSRRRKSIETMSTAQLGTLVDDLAPPTQPAVPIGKVVQSVLDRVAALDTAADAMVDRIDEVEPEVVVEIRAAVSRLLKRIDAAAQG